MNDYTIIYYYDVWGNAEDGWTVNDQTEVGTVSFPESASDQEILDLLTEKNFIDSEFVKNVKINSDMDIIEILNINDDYPYYGLYRKKEIL